MEEDNPKIIGPIKIIDLNRTACSIEFCPTQTNLGSLGIYQTEQIIPTPPPNTINPLRASSPSSSSDSNCPELRRIGGCILFSLIHQNNHLDPTSDSIEPSSYPSIPIPSSTKLEETYQPINYQEIQSIECPAILDLRWNRDVQRPILITADAQGNLTTYQLINHSQHQLEPDLPPRLELIQSLPLARSSGILSLSLDVSDQKFRTSNPKVVSSLSNGEIVLLDLHQSPTMTTQPDLLELDRWLGHEFEPWCCGFDYWQPAHILTGGDDCQLKMWDSRHSFAQPVMINKQFEGGVTAVRSHHLKEHIFAVGSYDSGLRIFDKRNIRRPLINKSVGGGIWRLKWHEVEAEKLLLATMHDGFKVVELIEEEEEAQARTGEPGTASESERPMTPVEGHDPIESKDRTKSDSSDDRSHRYSQLKLHSIFRHRSNLAYGVDWGLINYYPPSSSSSSSIPSRPTRVRNTLVGSCSFYDRAMHFWSVDGS